MTVPKTMRKKILLIKDTSNVDYFLVHFAPTRDAENPDVVTLHDSVPIHKEVARAVDLKPGDIVEL